MTKLPHPSWQVKGVLSPAGAGQARAPYKVGPKCSICGKWADHSHHLWRRSFLAGPYAWVELPDGTIVGNLTGLCFHCHKEVTENRVNITYEDESFWARNGDVATLLNPQPPTSPEAPMPDPPSSGDVAECPTCGRRKRRKDELPVQEKKQRKTWSISVPKDSQEDGADVLDTLLLECAKLFGRDDDQVWRYFTLTEALALVVQHGHLLTKEE